MYNRTLTRVLIILVLAGCLLTAATEALVRSARESRDLKPAGEGVPVSGPAAAGANGAGAAVGESPSAVTSGPGSAFRDTRTTLYADYQRKFRDTESAVGRLRESGHGNDSAASGDEAAAELRYWETQLNSLYQDIMQTLTDEEAAVLARDQQDWRKQREEGAAAAMRQNQDSRQQRAGFILYQASFTRQRALDLLEQYREQLSVSYRQPGG